MPAKVYKSGRPAGSRSSGSPCRSSCATPVSTRTMTGLSPSPPANQSLAVRLTWLTVRPMRCDVPCAEGVHSSSKTRVLQPDSTPLT